MRRNKIYLNLALILLFVFGCERFIAPENETQISKWGDDESHYFGQNCMDCHYSEGRGEGWFTAAGSAKGNTLQSVIELYLDTNSSTKHILQFDGLGNAYTTEPINYDNGFYVGIRSNTNQIKFMPYTIHTGQCNLCHGATEKELNINW